MLLKSKDLSLEELYRSLGCDPDHGEFDDTPRLLTKEQGESLHGEVIRGEVVRCKQWA